jgi:hypothetical protein
MTFRKRLAAYVEGHRPESASGLQRLQAINEVERLFDWVKSDLDTFGSSIAYG